MRSKLLGADVTLRTWARIFKLKSMRALRVAQFLSWSLLIYFGSMSVYGSLSRPEPGFGLADFLSAIWVCAPALFGVIALPFPRSGQNRYYAPRDLFSRRYNFSVFFTYLTYLIFYVAVSGSPDVAVTRMIFATLTPIVFFVVWVIGGLWHRRRSRLQWGP